MGGDTKRLPSVSTDFVNTNDDLAHTVMKSLFEIHSRESRTGPSTAPVTSQTSARWRSHSGRSAMYAGKSGRSRMSSRLRNLPESSPLCTPARVSSGRQVADRGPTGGRQVADRFGRR